MIKAQLRILTAHSLFSPAFIKGVWWKAAHGSALSTDMSLIFKMSGFSGAEMIIKL